MSLLREQRPNDKAMESSGMAVEMFLKAHLCISHGFTNGQAKKLGHNLEAALNAIIVRAPTSEFHQLRGRLTFPDVGARYVGNTYSGDVLWQAYKMALYTGACTVRATSSRNVRGQLALVF